MKDTAEKCEVFDDRIKWRVLLDVLSVVKPVATCNRTVKYLQHFLDKRKW